MGHLRLPQPTGLRPACPPSAAPSGLSPCLRDKPRACNSSIRMCTRALSSQSTATIYRHTSVRNTGHTWLLAQRARPARWQPRQRLPTSPGPGYGGPPGGRLCMPHHPAPMGARPGASRPLPSSPPPRPPHARPCPAPGRPGRPSTPAQRGGGGASNTELRRSGREGGGRGAGEVLRKVLGAGPGAWRGADLAPQARREGEEGERDR